MWLNVIEEKLTSNKNHLMLVSSFANCAGGGAMPLAGAPHDLHTQLLACSSSQSVFALTLLPACQFCAVFYLTLPPPLF